MMISEDAYNKVLDLMESRDGNDPQADFTEDQKCLIKELAAEFRQHDLYRNLKKRHKEDERRMLSMSACDIYMHMIERIASAHYVILMQSVPIIMIPILYDRLKADELRK